MRNVTDIIRPASVEEAVALLRRDRPRTAALAGGAALVGAASPDVEAVVDLSSLSLAYIRSNRATLHIGAMTTLQALADSLAIRSLAGGHVARAAHAATSSLLRRQATLGGSLISRRAPQLATLLAALDAQIVIHEPQPVTLPVADLYAMPWDGRRGLLTEVVIPARNAVGVGVHSVRRTPTDAPSVCVAAALTLDGEMVAAVGLAAGGAVIDAPDSAPARSHAPWPLRFAVAEAALTGKPLSNRLIETASRFAVADTPAIEDYLASVEYRAAMVGVLLRRALGDAWRAALEAR